MKQITRCLLEYRGKIHVSCRFICSCLPFKFFRTSRPAFASRAGKQLKHRLLDYPLFISSKVLIKEVGSADNLLFKKSEIGFQVNSDIFLHNNLHNKLHYNDTEKELSY